MKYYIIYCGIYYEAKFKLLEDGTYTYSTRTGDLIFPPYLYERTFITSSKAAAIREFMRYWRTADRTSPRRRIETSRPPYTILYMHNFIQKHYPEDLI